MLGNRNDCVHRCLPVVLVMLPFAVVTTAGHYHILDHVYKCTCWYGVYDVLILIVYNN